MPEFDVKLKNRRLPFVLAVAVAVLVLAVAVGLAAYSGDYYRSNDVAAQAVGGSGAYAGNGVSVENVDGMFAFIPPEPEAGFIFYPGAKVAPSAYAPLMQDLAEREVLCVVCPMPLNLAVFGIDEAASVPSKFPEVGEWFIGGHSLGGSMAAQYASQHPDDFAGIVFLASYPAVDLSGSNLAALSVYGTDDGVLNMQKYEEALVSMPRDFAEVVIDGGNHAQFGDYGEQAGDGVAGISAVEQQGITSQALIDWMF